MKTLRLQLSRAKGFNLQEHSRALNGLEAVNVARPSRWGNPWKVVYRNGWFVDGPRANPFQHPCGNKMGAQHIAVECFRDAPEGASSLTVSSLRGKNLACWCGIGDPCHADVLLELANRPICEEA